MILNPEQSRRFEQALLEAAGVIDENVIAGSVSFEYDSGDADATVTWKCGTRLPAEKINEALRKAEADTP